MALFKKRISANSIPSEEPESETKPEHASATEILPGPEHGAISDSSPFPTAAAAVAHLPEWAQASNSAIQAQVVESEPVKGGGLSAELYNRMTVCFVCGETAKPGTEFIKNYGGVTCFSCRAFFRRATQSDKTKAWFCINGEKCSLTVATRLNCKKCRYIRCLEAGMLPEMVLNSDQKKHRFRRQIAREKGRSPNADSRPADRSGGADDEDGDGADDSPDQFEHLSPKLMQISEAYRRTVERPEEPTFKLPEMAVPPEAAGRLSTNHQMRDVFIGHLAESCDNYRSFANSLSQFSGLPEEVQEELLSKSMPLFVQLLIAFYFTAATGKDKFRRLLKLHPRYKLDRTKHFDEIMNIFAPATDLQFVDNVLATFRLLTMDSDRTRAVLAYAILFDQDVLEGQDEDLSILYILNNLLFESCLIDTEILFSLRDLRSNLTKLSIFFASNVDDVDSGRLGNGAHRRYIFMDYTREEEIWLQGQLKLLEEAYGSVTLGHDFVQDFILHSSGKPVPPNSLVLSKQPLCERMLRVFNLHEEFRRLPGTSQMEYLMLNGTAGIVLVVARLELVADGFKQLQECFGVWDDQVWEQSFRPYLALPAQIDKVYMTNHPKIGAHDVPRWIRHGQILANLAKFISDPTIFRLLLLLTLTKTTTAGNGQPSSEMGQLHAMYLNTIQRHLRWCSKKLAKCGALLGGPAVADPNEIADCLQSIQFLARLHMEMISQLG